MVFENGVRNIQAAAYNGARTVPNCKYDFKDFKKYLGIQLWQTNTFLEYVKCHFQNTFSEVLISTMKFQKK